MNCKKILFLDILTGDDALRESIERAVYGGKTYGEQMREMADLAPSEFISLDASKGDLPDPGDFRAVIIGGSVEDPIEGLEKGWMFPVYEFIKRIFEKDTPTLGICGGLQFTVRALGGEVVKNPEGREFGTLKVSLTEEGKRDFLFEGLEKDLILSESHKCIAYALKDGWTLLAGSRKTPIEAIGIGNNIRLTQFHPEMNLEVVRRLADSRKKVFAEEGFVLSPFADTEEVGRKILSNFLRRFPG